jgi:tRNA (cmo5U34)-methyltransferase
MRDSANFDVQSPMPISEYEQTVRQVNIGYDLVFTLAHCFLRAQARPELEILVVGAGGGAEIEQFLPENPGWRLTGVDPSREMLALAQAKADRLGADDRVTLIQGTVLDVPPEPRFDVATCLFVLHFLPDETKLALLREVAKRLRPKAPLVAASGTRVDDGGLRDDLLGAWQCYGELMGMPGEQMKGTIQQLMAREATMTAEADYVRLMHEAGFRRVVNIFRVMGGGLAAWIAR